MADDRGLRRFIPAVEALAVPASLHDPEGRFVYMNVGAERVSGRLNAQTVGLHVTDLLPPEARDHVGAQFRRAVAEGEPSDFATKFVDAQGNEGYTRAQHLPLLEDGRVIAVLVLAWQALAPPTREATQHGQLTPRQLEVLALLAAGRSTLEIARELDLAHPTVRNHVRDLLAQLDAHTRVEAVAKAQSAGLLSLRPLEPLRSSRR